MKSILLAGGSGGLGAVVSRAVKAAGYRPVIGYLRNRERAEALARELGTVAVGGDITEEGVRRRLIEEAGSAGELYGLVVLAGDPARIPIETATAADLAASMSSNFIGPVLLARDFARSVQDRDASIVLLSTMQGVSVFPNSTVYAAPKAALVHTAKILAKQWKLRINVVAPGVNNAGMAEQSVRSGKYDAFLEKQVIPRWGKPEDVAKAILFFLEPDGYVTGQVLTVDGGLSLKM
jgi:NAD(P)-dependent dehydrogenase (short-subunit alcohol dehydrogenase family)